MSFAPPLPFPDIEDLFRTCFENMFTNETWRLPEQFCIQWTANAFRKHHAWVCSGGLFCTRVGPASKESYLLVYVGVIRLPKRRAFDIHRHSPDKLEKNWLYCKYSHLLKRIGYFPFVFWIITVFQHLNHLSNGFKTWCILQICANRGTMRARRWKRTTEGQNSLYTICCELVMIRAFSVQLRQMLCGVRKQKVHILSNWLFKTATSSFTKV